MSSPTQRTLQYLRERGHVAQVVEYWNPHARRRVDLFGILDIVSVHDGRVFGWQACAGSGVSARVRKVQASPLLPSVAAAMSVRVIGWRRYRRPVDGRWWRPRIIPVGTTEEERNARLENEQKIIAI